MFVCLVGLFGLLDLGKNESKKEARGASKGRFLLNFCWTPSPPPYCTAGHRTVGEEEEEGGEENTYGTGEGKKIGIYLNFELTKRKTKLVFLPT